MTKIFVLVSLLVLCSIAQSYQSAYCQTSNKTLIVETGSVGSAYNTVQEKYKPTSGPTGTRFSFLPLIGTKGKVFARVTYETNINPNHGWRFVYAPLNQTGTGVFTQPVSYRGTTFAANTPTRGQYLFNGYRATYFSRLTHTETHETRVGITLNIRDAAIRLQQGSRSAGHYNLGVVPVAYLYTSQKVGKKLMLSAEADALAAPQGRLFDGALRAHYALTPTLDVLIGIRTLEGGAARKGDFYNFTRFNALTLGIAQKF
jgi:hypothetical protein